MSSQYRDADVVVIGAGAGGLTAAAKLAAAGRHVVVVDRQGMPGGNTAAFSHQDYEFDIGLHYLGAVGAHRPGIRAFLEPLGIDLTFRRQDPDGFDTLLFDDGEFAVPAGFDAFRSRLHERFPQERGAIDRFLDKVEAVGRELEQPLPRGARDALGYMWRSRDVVATARSTLGHELDRLDCSPRLRVVLCWLHGIYGVPPAQAALGMHAAAMQHYLNGAWYPEGGANAVSGALADVIARHGGELLLDVEATRILLEGGAVRGVRVAPGPAGRDLDVEELRAPVVVAAGDVKRTFLELLGPDQVPARLRRRVRNFEMAAPLFAVYLVLDRDLRAEGMPNRNWSVIDCDDIDSMYAAWRHGQLPAQQWTWITSASLKDPGNPRLCRPGQTNLQIMTGAPASRAFWDVGPNLERGAGYAQRKRELRDRAVRHAERAIPGLADAIAYEDAATPITLERYLGSTGGTSYGIAATPGQFGLMRPGAKTPIGGLFLAGASTRTAHGITGAMHGGAVAAKAVMEAEARHREPAAEPVPT